MSTANVGQTRGGIADHQTADEHIEEEVDNQWCDGSIVVERC